ncbi:MAG: GTP-binding and nucleic acid-binding protein YchF, partial [uncultured Solirubrobacterales bacterium]
EDRHRRPAERRQVVALQRADAGRRHRRQLSVHHRRAERRRGLGPRRAPRARGRDHRRDADRARDDRLPRHRRPGSRGLARGGARQPVPGQHSRDRSD